MIWTSVLHVLAQNASLLKVRNRDVAHQLSLCFHQFFQMIQDTLEEDCVLTGPGLILAFFLDSPPLSYPHPYLIGLHSFCKHLLNPYSAQDFISFKLLVQSSFFF